MQANGFPVSVDVYPLFLPQDTDTLTPPNPIPIHYIHTLNTPFCGNLGCICRQRKADAARLLDAISKGSLLLQEAAHYVEAVPVSCQDYGQEWERTLHPGVKECRLCGIRGYCPFCTATAPQGTPPFSCTKHTLSLSPSQHQSEVQ